MTQVGQLGLTFRGVGGVWQIAGMAERPPLPPALLHRLTAVMTRFPECVEEDAWVGVRWRVGQATVAHVFGGEDQRFRITFRADAGEVLAFEHLGPQYFRTDWGENVVGVLLTDATDWDELAEFLTDSYCIQAPARLADQVPRPGS